MPVLWRFSRKPLFWNFLPVFCREPGSFAIRIYSEPVLRKFLEEQRQAHPDLDLPEPPQAGDLDIRQVIESPYFFA